MLVDRIVKTTAITQLPMGNEDLCRLFYEIWGYSYTDFSGLRIGATSVQLLGNK